jgi:hypothetical protein
MKGWVCCGLVALVVALGLGLSEASAHYYHHGFVGVTAWPGAYYGSYWGPRAYVAPPVYVAAPAYRAYVVPRRVYYAPAPVYVAPPPCFAAPSMYYW